MPYLKKITLILILGLTALTLSGCPAKVGSERWCQDMKDKPKADWTANEAVDFTKNCVF